MIPTLTSDALAPFASYAVMERTNPHACPDLLSCQVFAEVLGCIEECGGDCRDLREVPVVTTGGLSLVHAVLYSEERPVKWVRAEAKLRDHLNHILVIAYQGNRAALYLSDSEHRSTIQDVLVRGGFENWKPVEQALLIGAFVAGNPLRTLWLGGTHRNVSVKANSKVLSGNDLRDALDPFGDSTFVAGAVRSNVAGISLKRSGVWLGPTRDWQSFLARVESVLTSLSAAKTDGNSEVHAALAVNLSSLSGVERVFHVEWAESDTFDPDSRARKLQELSLRFTIGDASPMAGGGAGALIDVTNNDEKVNGGVTLTPSISCGRVHLLATGGPNALDEWRSAVESDPELIRVFYDTGHTIARASLSLANVQDREFQFTFCNFSPAGEHYDVTAEKPEGNPVPLCRIVTAGDHSLFKWVYKEGLRQLGLAQPSAKRCWLYCDDGSGEVADFIHVEIGKPRITLFHVKGARSSSDDRRVCAGPYELVVAQAMKNLRRLSAAVLRGDIQNCVRQHGNERVWDNRWGVGQAPAARSEDLLDALEDIGSNCEYGVYVVQPHVRHTNYFRNQTMLNSTGAKQLRSLLYGAAAMARSAQAQFHVVVDGS